MTTHPFDAPELQRLAEQAGELVSRWVEASAEIPEDKAAEQLAGVLKDPHGLEFTVGFVDGVIRPEDDAAAEDDATIGGETGTDDTPRPATSAQAPAGRG